MVKVQYWHQPNNSDIPVDISAQITVHVSGGEVINQLPGSFKFSVTPYKVENNKTIISPIDINIGDKFFITQDLITIIASGSCFDPGRKIETVDRKNNRAVCSFDVVCYQNDFSSYPIDELSFVDMEITSILDEIMLYTDSTIGVSDVGKYLLTFDTYKITFSIEQKSARDALTELCEQIDSFWRLKYRFKEGTFIIERYIEICSSAGSAPDSDSSWLGGINTSHLINQTLPNPVLTNRLKYPVIAAESDFKIQVDPSVMINWIDITCKVYESSDGSILERYDTPALPDEFDYELNGYADDVVACATLVSAKVLTGSSSSIVKIASRFATDIETENLAFFPDTNGYNDFKEVNFFAVTGVNKVDNFITEISFSPTLPFTPSTGKTFEIIGNHKIFRKEKEVEYSTKGILIDVDKKNYGKVKFLPLCEPPVGQTIVFFYKKVTDYTLRTKNQESIERFGLKYKPLTLDDDMVLTRDELNNLSSNLLVLTPLYKFLVETRRYGIAPIGFALAAQINNFITENFILNENEWEFLGVNDYNRVPMFIQLLTFSTRVNDPERVLERFKRLKKKSSTSADVDDINKQIETVKCQEGIHWDFDVIPNEGLPPPKPTNLRTSNKTSSGFQCDWDAEGDPEFIYIELTTNDFADVVQVQLAGNIRTYTFDSLLPNTIYKWRVWSQKYDLDQGFPSPETVPTESTYPLSGLQAYYKCNNNLIDSSGNGRNGLFFGDAYFDVDALVLPKDNISYATLPPEDLHGLTDFTISLWCKLNEVNSDINTMLSGAYSTNYNSFDIWYEGSANTWTIYQDITSNNFINGSVEDLEWHHLTFTRSGSSIKFYVDKVLIGTISGTSSAIQVQNIVLGQEQDSFGGTFDATQAFAGKIDNLFIYNRAISDAENTQLYDLGHNN